MQQYSNTFMTDLGRPVRPESNPQIAVYTYPGNVLAVLYSDNGVTPKQNPTTTDENGLFEFYAADGRYSLTLTSDVTSSVTLTDSVLLEDPADGGSSQMTYIQSGAGAVSRTVQEGLRRIVADGDYDTNQNAAISSLGRPYFVAASASVQISIPADTADLQSAMTAIARWVIPDSSTVTIALPSGTISASSPYTLNHPYGSRINIVGANTVTTTASAAGAVTGSAGAWAVPLTVASAAGIAAGDYALIRNATGTGRYKLFSGICRVASVVGSTVTVTNTAKNAAWPTAALTAADITVVKTILSFTGCDGLRIDSSIGSIDKIAIVGDKTSGTIGIIGQRMSRPNKSKAMVYLGQNVGISSFGDGGIYAQAGGTVDAAYVCVADCLVYNILAQHGGSVMANFAISSGSAQIGFAGSNSGDVSAEYSIAVGNGTYGYYAQSGGSLTLPYSFAWANVSDGARSAWGGSIRGQNLDTQYNGGAGAFVVGGFMVIPSCVASNNSSSGVYAEGGGNIYASGATCSSNTGYGAYCDGATIDCPTSAMASNSINGANATNGGAILADQLSGASNGTYLVSATKGAMIRATSASAAGVTVNSDSGGLVDVTSATGSPTLNLGAGGRIIDTSGVLRWGQIAVMRDSTYNSELTASLILKNATDPLKWLVAGYDNTRDYAYVQSIRSTAGYKALALNPNAGNVGIGLVANLPTARLHLPAGAAGAGNAPLKLTAGTNLTTPEDGTFEYNGTNLFFTVGSTRKTVTLV